MSSRRLIINADDFGLSEKTNLGIIAARQKGVLTSASLMVCRPAAEAAAQYARSDPSLSIGLHADFGDWTLSDGQWVRTSGLTDMRNPVAVELELRRQLARFRNLMGCNPTHLDSHQHVHKDEQILPVFRILADQLGVPLRSYSPVVQYCGAFFGADENMAPRLDFVSPANLIYLLDQFPAGISELGAHPGLDPDLVSDYRDARPAEVQTLCDPIIRQVIADRGIILMSFADMKPDGSVDRSANIGV